MKAVLQRVWRVPKPQCNWCPRLTFVLVLWEDEDATCIEIPNGHNKTHEEIMAYVNERLGARVDTLIELFSEVEVTKRQFKVMKGWDRS